MAMMGIKVLSAYFGGQDEKDIGKFSCHVNWSW